jgi:hypothetical protein
MEPRTLYHIAGYTLTLHDNRLELEAGAGMFKKREAFLLRSITDVRVNALRTKVSVVTQDGKSHDIAVGGPKAEEVRQAILAAL